MKWKKIYKDGTIREVDMNRDTLWDIALDAWLDYRESPKRKNKKSKQKGMRILGMPVWLFIIVLIIAFPFVILFAIIKVALEVTDKSEEDRKYGKK